MPDVGEDGPAIGPSAGTAATRRTVSRQGEIDLEMLYALGRDAECSREDVDLLIANRVDRVPLTELGARVGKSGIAMHKRIKTIVAKARAAAERGNWRPGDLAASFGSNPEQQAFKALILKESQRK